MCRKSTGLISCISRDLFQRRNAAEIWTILAAQVPCPGLSAVQAPKTVASMCTGI